MNYNNTLLFPAIAICNQNDFRKTRAYEEKIYDLVGMTMISIFKANKFGIGQAVNAGYFVIINNMIMN